MISAIVRSATVWTGSPRTADALRCSLLTALGTASLVAGPMAGSMEARLV
jgi:hypothetical protein